MALPPEIIAKIEQGIADGVYLKMTRRPRKVTEIGWAPGEPNKLAEVIIKDVHEPITLVLDGHYYRIEPLLDLPPPSRV